MPISDNDYKILWGRAAGVCSNPECRQDLTILLMNGKAFNIGEMAHVIARKPDGPRGVPGGGDDTYENLILLCPTCHRLIDKAPKGVYTENMLHKWKDDHENEIRQVGKNRIFEDTNSLKAAIRRLLAENHSTWKLYGPKSMEAQSNPGSNMYKLWEANKLSVIVPNNRKIINFVESNLTIINDAEYEEFLKFKAHAEAFERNQYNRLDSYPLFPQSFAEVMNS